MASARPESMEIELKSLLSLSLRQGRSGPSTRRLSRSCEFRWKTTTKQPHSWVKRSEDRCIGGLPAATGEDMMPNPRA
ncbi:hypothetical protein K443DRAFT_686049 [Laccaria amethystina LaAM-08-1]|uniref:Uncharacterized protein n=1 Tax=Laccaria amethystina LaAM-08-1 TaxID=1095629 RepID=A0A0C9X4J7_9AGAR|nr:hypothetical protein K443DRAFT_686049 [Laccaria amethystina LaAM-08-1]